MKDSYEILTLERFRQLLDLSKDYSFASLISFDAYEIQKLIEKGKIVVLSDDDGVIFPLWIRTTLMYSGLCNTALESMMVYGSDTIEFEANS